MKSQTGVDDAKFKEFLNDAEVNHQNQRYTDAAKTFEFLSEWCLENKMPEDMVYFQYRALVDYKIEGKIDSLVSHFQKLAINALKASTVYALSEVNSPHVENKIALLWYVQQNLKMLDDEAKRKSILLKLHHIFQQILEDESLDKNQKIQYLDKSIELSNDLGYNDQLINACKMKCEIIEKEGEAILKSNGYDVNIVAAHKFLEAAQIYGQISEFEKLNTLVKKAQDLYPEINLEKYDLKKSTASIKRSN